MILPYAKEAGTAGKASWLASLNLDHLEQIQIEKKTKNTN